MLLSELQALLPAYTVAGINFVLTRIYQEGRFSGTVQPFAFNVYEALEGTQTYHHVTLGRRHEAAVGVKYISDTGARTIPAEIYGEWFEWRPGSKSKGYASGLMDLGLWATFREWDVDSALTVTTESAATGTMQIAYFDANGTYQSTTVDLSASPVTTSAVIPAGARIRVAKPSVATTVRIYGPIDGVSSVCAIFEGTDTDPQFRRYRCADYTSALVRCKMRHISVAAANDHIIPDNIVALQYGLEAKNYEDKHDHDRAELMWQKMYKALDDQLHQQRGEAVPVINTFGTLGYDNYRFSQ